MVRTGTCEPFVMFYLQKCRRRPHPQNECASCIHILSPFRWRLSCSICCMLIMMGSFNRCTSVDGSQQNPTLTDTWRPAMCMFLPSAISLSNCIIDDANQYDLPSFLTPCPSMWLLGFGVITNDHVEAGFRGVDRKFFVPRVRYITRVAFCISFSPLNLYLLHSFMFYAAGEWVYGSLRPATERRKRPHLSASYLWICHRGFGSRSQFFHLLFEYW